jgi:hypothetical protein
MLFRQRRMRLRGGSVFAFNRALILESVARLSDLSRVVGGDAGFSSATVAVGGQLVDTAGALFKAGGTGVGPWQPALC